MRLEAYLEADQVCETETVVAPADSQDSFEQAHDESFPTSASLVKGQVVLDAYETFAKGYRRKTIAALQTGYAERVPADLPPEESRQYLKQLVYEQLNASHGHELKFWKSYSEGDLIGAK